MSVFLNSSSIDDLESIRSLLNVLLLFSTAAVVIGVWFERDTYPEDVKKYGWSLVWKGVAGELLFAAMLWQVDTSIGLKQNALIGSLFDRAAKAELELAKIREPRTISPKKQAAIITCLQIAPKGPVLLRPKSFDWEPEQYSKQIEQVLKSGGFLDTKEVTEATFSWNLPGIFMILKNLQQVPSHAVAIQKCFKAEDIIFPAYAGEVPKDAVLLGISTRN